MKVYHGSQNHNMAEEKAIDLYYKSQTCKILSDKSSALYQKPWTEIYEMLLRELNLK
jgi:hypothetical protein